MKASYPSSDCFGKIIVLRNKICFIKSESCHQNNITFEASTLQSFVAALLHYQSRHYLKIDLIWRLNTLSSLSEHLTFQYGQLQDNSVHFLMSYYLNGLINK